MAATRIKRISAFLLANTILGAGLLLAAALSAVATMRFVLSSQEVVVPSLVGRKVDQAGKLAARHRLLLRVEGKRNDASVAPDGIMAQDPPAGTNLKAQRSVRVWVSLGPRRLKVPMLEGQSLRTARLTLDQLDLKLARVVEARNPAEAGTILIQTPPAGEADSVGEGLALLVSGGPGMLDYVMPDLIGRRLDEAEAVLRQAGLAAGEISQRSYPGVQAGVVLRHVPAAGHRVNNATPVAFEVSKPS